MKKQVLEWKHPVLIWVLDQFKLYGLPFVILGVFLYFTIKYFLEKEKAQDARIEILHTDIQKCNDRIIELYQEDHRKLLEIMSKNADAFEKLSR